MPALRVIVTRPADQERLTVSVDLDDLTAGQRVEAASLVGLAAMTRLSEDWDADAASALLYVALRDKFAGLGIDTPAFHELDADWSRLVADALMEETLPMTETE